MFLCLARDYPLALGTVEPNSVDIHQGDTGDLAFVFLGIGLEVAAKWALREEAHPDHNIAVVGDSFLRDKRNKQRKMWMWFYEIKDNILQRTKLK